jgi:hypothetical protein
MNEEIHDPLAPPKCEGVIHHLLDRALVVNPRYVIPHWNIVNGRPVSKNCNGIPRKGMPNCFKCQRSHSSIKRGRYPLLFDDIESATDKYTLNRATIEQELQRLWISEGRSQEAFRLQSEVIFLCRLIVFRGDTGSFVLDGDRLVICCKNAGPKFPLCQPVPVVVPDLSADGACATPEVSAIKPEVGTYECQFFFIISRRKDEAFCAACKRYEKSQKRKRDSREKDVGKRLAIGSTVNRSNYTPEECQLFIKKQAVEIRRLNRLLPKQAPESIINETKIEIETIGESQAPQSKKNESENETISESVEGYLVDM